ncbi:MAG: nitric oxide-sensing protein NosP [Motiliproteus sp.]
MIERVKIGCSAAKQPQQAIMELKQQLDQPDLGLVLVFFSIDYDLPAIAAELESAFAGVTVVGCTTAGEIGPLGYSRGSISGISFPAADFSASVGLFSRLQDLSLGTWRQSAARLHGKHNQRYQLIDDDGTFGLLLVDGMSIREEPLVRMVTSVMSHIPIIGGSAGDDLHFESTYVLHQGKLYADSALLILITTALPFKAFKAQHFVSTDQRMVVTAALPEQRIVTEINGRLAGPEYARLLGVDAQQLTPMVFAAHPVVVKMGDSEYVRSIQKVNDDGSLTFFCAIDVGIVLRIASGVDLVTNLSNTFKGLKETLGPAQAMITCDCILRRLEIEQKGLSEQVSELLKENRSIGFSTYGEQIDGIHVNQTCTGIVIGYERD